MDEKKIDWLEGINLNEEKGEIMIAGHRGVIVDAHSFKAHRDAIADIIGHGSDAVLYLAGKRHTVKFVKETIKRTAIAGFIKRFKWGRGKIAEKVVEIMRQYGFGVTMIEKLDLDGESVLLMDNSCIATAYKKKQKTPVCSYIAGLLAGGAEGITDKSFECVETHCVAKGDKHCRFVLTADK